MERSAIDANGLNNLSDFLPKKPTAVELNVIKEMFEASVDGQAYDPDRWSQYFKPVGFKGSSNDGDEERATTSTRSSVAPTPRVTPKTEVNEDEVPFDVDDTPPVASTAPKPAATNARAEDILAMIRSRQK